MRYCVGNLKGGTGKTTTSVMLALALALGGWPTAIAGAGRLVVGGQLAPARRVLLVCCDPDQPQAYEWHADAGASWPATCTVLHVATRDLAARVGPHLASYDDVIFDCGAKNLALLRAAMSLSDHLVIPTRPTIGEAREVWRIIEIAQQIDRTRPEDSPLTAAVLLVQVRTSTASESDVREEFAERGIPVMASRVRMLLRYEQLFGTVPRGAGQLADYADVVAELVA